jgi:ferritin-like protein
MESIRMERIRSITEAESVGSIPPVEGEPELGVLLDKMGERLAFERTGTRLYDALITKYEALSRVDGNALAPASEAAADNKEGLALSGLEDETPAQTLARIRDEELAHFKLLADAMMELGGDPTAQTPCADVVGTASMGFMQVLSDPRTTLAQCLNTMLAAELADNAGWELLIQLADDAGASDLAGQFLAALAEEQEHLTIIKSWLTSLVSSGAGTPAV